MSFGFQNLGNTCYMASILQALLCITPLNKYILRKNSHHKLLIEYKNIILSLKSNTSLIYPIDFHKNIQNLAIRRRNNEFNSYKQCDAHEFLIFFIDAIHEYLKKPVQIDIEGQSENSNDDLALDAMNQWKIFYENGFSDIIQIFGGQFFSKIESKHNNVGYISHNFDPFTNLFLDIPEGMYDDLSIYQLFDNFTKPELIPSKPSDGDTTKSVLFWELPEYLIITFKRFTQNNKINSKIDFPITNLNLTKYIQGYNENNGIYDLIAIVNHTGTLNSGHYYSYCLRDDIWLNMNDSNISTISKKKLCSENAYCLFYKKRI